MSTMNFTAESINSAMIKVYQYVFGALLFTGAIAFGVEHTPALLSLSMNWVVQIVLFIASLFLTTHIASARAEGDTVRGKLVTLFVTFAAIWGFLLAGVFARHAGSSIFLALISASILFLVMSAYGYFTKRDIVGFGPYFMIALIALILVSIVNVFVGSSTGSFVISIFAVLLFLGITAWDAQATRELIFQASNENELAFAQINGAVGLYLSFLNLFLNLLNLGDRD